MDISQLSIAQIKSEINKLAIEQYPEFATLLMKDSRRGVQQLSVTVQNK